MEQQNAVSEKLNPNRAPREPFGIKARSTLNRITLTLSEASPNETLYVEIPKLAENIVLVPGSVYLTFDLNVTGHANNTLVNNVGRNLVKRQRVLFGGEVLQDTLDYDLFQTYHDFFLSKEARDDMLWYGVSNVNTRKLRTDPGDKDDSTDAKEVAMAALYGTKYCIPLDHPILLNHGVFYPKGLSHPLKFEITLGGVSDIVVYSDTTKPPNCKITNLELEYQSVSSEYLANRALEAYKVGHVFYENVLRHKTFTFSKPNDSVINEHVNVLRRSMTGLLFLITAPSDAGTRDSEKIVNPDITSVKIDIDGVPNMLYSRGMISTDLYKSILQRFTGDTSVKEKDFYTNDKFALWIDLRTHSDNNIHGSGLALRDTRDGVKLEIRRTTGGSGTITCHMFIVADALMEIRNSSLRSIMY